MVTTDDFTQAEVCLTTTCTKYHMIESSSSIFVKWLLGSLERESVFSAALLIILLFTPATKSNSQRSRQPKIRLLLGSNSMMSLEMGSQVGNCSSLHVFSKMDKYCLQDVLDWSCLGWLLTSCRQSLYICVAVKQGYETLWAGEATSL